MDTAYAKDISLLWNSPTRYSTSFWYLILFSNFCVILFLFHYLQSRVLYFCMASCLGGGTVKVLKKKQKTHCFLFRDFSLTKLPSMGTFPSPSTCFPLRSFLSWPSAFFFWWLGLLGGGWKNMATFSMLPLGKKILLYIDPMKNRIPVSFNQTAWIMVHGIFSGMVFHGSGWPPPK